MLSLYRLGVGGVIAAWVGLMAAAALGDATNDLAASMKLRKSLPIWTPVQQADADDLTEIVSTLHPSVFLVGVNGGGHGTAFVISRENRLLATNAHVADIMYQAGDMLAIGNGTSQVMRVEDVFYHPGVRRLANNTAVRTSNPAYGDVYPCSPDVAVLKLADGEELPSALPLARPDEARGLLARPVGMLGYPGHDTECWPRLGEKAAATYHQGVVCRETDFYNDVNAPPEELQFLQHSMANYPGFSGSPIFLRNGRVVALNNCGRMAEAKGLSTQLSYGIRVDCLWELLKQHQLWEDVAPDIDVSLVDVERFSRPDPQEEKLNQVRRLLALARIDVANHDDTAAVKKCNEAVAILPNYEPIYDVRANAYNYHAVHKIGDRSPEALKYYEYAYKDSLKAAELAPTSHDHYLDVALGMLNAKNATAPLGSYWKVQDAIDLADEILKMESVRRRDRSYAYRVRALARGMGREVIDDLEKAIEVDPWIPQAYGALMMYYRLHGPPGELRKAEEKFRELSATRADSDRAWLAATSPDENHRNGFDALRLAKRACEATDYEWWEPVRALAAAHAEQGEFDEAVEYAEQAAELAPPEEAGAVRRQANSYRKKQPWRE